MRSSLTIFVAFVFAATLVAEEPSQEQSPYSMDLYLLIGQSNMAGRGRVAASDKKPVERLLMLNKANHWVPAADPMHFDKPKMVGVGLGKSFAVEMSRANPSASIGLIPCAVGGSPIASWQPGGFHKQTKTHPWDDMIKRLNVAMKSGKLKAILWHQGESDSNAQASKVYEAKLRSLIKRLREHVGDDDVPFLIGQLGKFADRPWDEHRERVDAVHRKVAGDTKHVAFVSSEGLGHKGDKTHFNSEAYRELGRRYAKALTALQ